MYTLAGVAELLLLLLLLLLPAPALPTTTGRLWG